MLIVFFDIGGIIMTEWVPEGQTVNQTYYKEVLIKLRERIRKKRPDLWKNEAWILHQDNAPAHNSLSVKQFLADKRIPVKIMMTTGQAIHFQYKEGARLFPYVSYRLCI
jgi:alpha-L-fucosidase